VYNAAGTVELAISSPLRQIHEHLEIVAVDDGSTDESPTIISRIHDSRLKLLRQDHQGLVGTLGLGCTQARGEYIARLDADDAAHERRIAAQVKHLEGCPEIGVLGTWAAIETEGGMVQTFAPPTSDAALRRYLLWDNPFVHSSVMFRPAVYQNAGGYSEGPNEDYRLWIRMARFCKLAELPEVLVTHRVRSASLSRAMQRRSALQARLQCQWEAASTLGPWHAAFPALAVTAIAYLLALLGGGLEPALRRLAGRRASHLRGFRDASSRDRSG